MPAKHNDSGYENMNSCLSVCQRVRESLGQSSSQLILGVGQEQWTWPSEPGPSPPLLDFTTHTEKRHSLTSWHFQSLFSCSQTSEWDCLIDWILNHPQYSWSTSKCEKLWFFSWLWPSWQPVKISWLTCSINIVFIGWCPGWPGIGGDSIIIISHQCYEIIPSAQLSQSKSNSKVQV